MRGYFARCTASKSVVALSMFSLAVVSLKNVNGGKGQWEWQGTRSGSRYIENVGMNRSVGRKWILREISICNLFDKMNKWLIRRLLRVI